MDRLLPAVTRLMTRWLIAAVLSFGLVASAGEGEAAWWTRRPAIVAGEVVGGVGAGLVTTALTSAAIIALGGDSPFRSPVSFTLLAALPPLAAASGAWAMGSLDRHREHRLLTAVIGAGAGAALALAGVAYYFTQDSPSPGIELAYALGLLLVGTPVLSALGAVIALETLGGQTIDVAVVPAISHECWGVAGVLRW